MGDIGLYEPIGGVARAPAGVEVWRDAHARDTTDVVSARWMARGLEVRPVAVFCISGNRPARRDAGRISATRRTPAVSDGRVLAGQAAGGRWPFSPTVRPGTAYAVAAQDSTLALVKTFVMP